MWKKTDIRKISETTTRHCENIWEISTFLETEVLQLLVRENTQSTSRDWRSWMRYKQPVLPLEVAKVSKPLSWSTVLWAPIQVTGTVKYDGGLLTTRKQDCYKRYERWSLKATQDGGTSKGGPVKHPMYEQAAFLFMEPAILLSLTDSFIGN